MLFSPKQNSLSLPQAGWTNRLRSAHWKLPVGLNTVPVWLKQFIKFGLIGVLNTLVDATIYFVLSRTILGSSLVLAKGISYLVGVIHSFYWNKTWTFKSHVETRPKFTFFLLANLLAVGLNVGVMHVALVFFGVSEPVALAFATGATFLWNFACSKFFIFKPGIRSGFSFGKALVYPK